MPDNLNSPAVQQDDDLDFRPLAAPKQKVQAMASATTADDDLDFQPIAQQPKSTPQPRPTTASPGQPTIEARTPTLMARAREVLTAGAPWGSFLRRYSGRVSRPGDEKRDPQLITPEAAMTPTEQHQHPIATGLGQLAGGLTTPENVLITAGTAGFGLLPGAAKTVLPRLVSGYFSAQMLKNAYDRYPEFRAAVDRGDESEAKRIATHIVGSAAFGLLSGRHAIEEGPTPFEQDIQRMNAEAAERGVANEPVYRGNTVEDLNAQRARESQANAAGARGMANLEGRLALRMPPTGRPALPPFRQEVETIGGEPVNVRMYESDEAPLLMPRSPLPERTSGGAIVAPESPLSSRKALPPANEGAPSEESEFLAGRPTAPTSLLRLLRPSSGAVESFAPGYRPRFAETQRVTDPDVGFVPGPVPDLPQTVGTREWRLAPDRTAAPVREAQAEPSKSTFTFTPPPAMERVQLEKAEASPYQRQQAQLSTNRLRNPVEREYAQSYLKARLDGTMEPEPISTLTNMRAKQLANRVEEYLGKQQAAKVAERFPADVIQEAEAELRAAAELESSFDRPGRYMIDPGEPGDVIQKRDLWYGIKSPRGKVAGQHSWYADEEITPAKMRTAIERGEGADYERIVGKIAEGIQAERESARPVIEEFAPHLRGLAGQVRDVDPDLAQSMLDLAEGKAVGFRNLREYIEEKIHDAEAARLFSQAVDEASEQAAEPSSVEEPAGLAGEPRSAEGILPGLEQAVAENHRAAGRHQAEQLTERISRPAESFESAAGEMERASPLFRGTEASPQREIFGAAAGEEEPGGTLFAGIDPARARAAVRVISQAWQEKIARPLIDRVLRIGDKYQRARAADPAVAEGLELLDNAPQYLRQKAAQIVHDVIGNLSRQQERLFVLMADADSRENLRTNHPNEFRAAQSDPAIQAALRRYRPIEQELTRMREQLGGQVLDQDYLRRVYDRYVAGVGHAEAPGGERARTAFDRVVRPARPDKLGREAEAEYYYKNGLHEFGPSFGAKFMTTHLQSLRDQVARQFLNEATQLTPGAPEPRSIEYNGQTYYRPDVAREMRDAGAKNVKVFDRYDPTAGEKFPQAADGKFLGPREVVRALNDFGRQDESQPGALRRFFQEQVISFGLGVPHIANIMRRVTQSVPGGALNPKGWVNAWRVALGKELRERGVKGLNDPTFDMLAQHGAITTGEMQGLKEYIGGNLNPANWARAMARVGHKILFEPGSAGGFAGIDQRARIFIADLVRSEHPDASDAQIARAVRETLGDYNRANWTDQQKMLSRFMLFPGWDFSSVKWVIQHPIRTTVPPAVLTLIANRVLHQLGANRSEDQSDIDTIHVGDRAYGVGALREPVARNLFRPFINYANAKRQGANEQRAQAAAARGVGSGAAGLLGMLRPDLSGFIALATNRQALFSGRELVRKDDLSTPGKILPSRALEQLAVFTVRRAVPSIDRMLDSDQELDLKSFAGGNLGLPNYRDDAERRLFRNAAEAEETYRTLSRLTKTNPAQAREYLRDPDNAAYALFHRDFASAVAALRRLDQTREHIEASGISKAEKQNRLRQLDQARMTLLGHVETLNNVLFERRQAAKPQGRGLQFTPGFLQRLRDSLPSAETQQ